MKNAIRIAMILIAIATLTISVLAMTHKCGISERIILENTTDTNVTYTFTRGIHEGFVVVEPGQAIIVDVVGCK